MSKKLCLLLLASCAWLQAAEKPTPPKVTIVFVIDQFAYHYLPKLNPFLKHGIKTLLTKGVVFDDAHHPLAVPETTPGHHAISTGTLPKYHGATYNSWINSDYKKVKYETDTTSHGDVFRNEQPCQPGASPHNTKVDGLSDRFMQAAQGNPRFATYSFSLKMHPVIACANRQGKAIWLDGQTGEFTSSKAYFESLPSWLTAFNKKHKAALAKPLVWKTAYPYNSEAYAFPFSRDYEHAGAPISMINETKEPVSISGVSPQELFVRAPQSSQLLLLLVKKAIKQLKSDGKDNLLLFVSLSNLDLCGHIYGPDSMECIDIIYNLDKQISNFMDFTNKAFGAKNVLYVLTGDHGVCPLPEITAKKGYFPARRILAKKLINEMNALVKEHYNLDDFVKAYEPTFFVLDQEAIKAQSRETVRKMLHELKEYLLKQPGIKKVWTRREIARLPFQTDDLEQLYKNQLYKNRNGDLTIMMEPYSLITNYENGTSHSSPYEYDTHVPLALYRKGHIQNKRIAEKVWVPQLPHTIARLLGITKPSASPYKPLPGIV